MLSSEEIRLTEEMENKNTSLISESFDIAVFLLNEYIDKPKYLNSVQTIINKYKSIRKIKRDGNCFYRGFIYRIFEYISMNNKTELYNKMLNKMVEARDLVKKDICKRICYLICDDDSPHGVFALFNKAEPTYQYIENGNWLNEDEYITLHRIASDGKLKGIFNFLIEYCKNISNNIRIDTHPNNHIMQNQIEKNDFKKCGTIYVADGSARIAYQWSKNHE